MFLYYINIWKLSRKVILMWLAIRQITLNMLSLLSIVSKDLNNDKIYSWLVCDTKCQTTCLWTDKFIFCDTKISFSDENTLSTC